MLDFFAKKEIEPGLGIFRRFSLTVGYTCEATPSQVLSSQKLATLLSQTLHHQLTAVLLSQIVVPIVCFLVITDPCSTTQE